MQDMISAEEMEKAVEKMTPEQRDHLRFVIGSLLEAYTDDECHALVLINHDKSTHFKIVAINSTDTETADLLERLDTYMNFRAMRDAPPKEAMN